MRGLSKIGTVAALGLVLLTCGVARAAEQQPDMATILNRLSRDEDEIANLKQLLGKSAPRQQIDRAQVTQIVQEEMKKGGKPTDLDVYWDKGLHFDSQDGAFKLKIGGRLQTDFATMKGDSKVEKAVGPLTDGTEIRRLYLSLGGSIYNNTKYAVDIDFAGAKVHLNNAYLQFNHVLPAGAALRVGQFNEPINMENMTSDLNITLIERALPSAMIPGYDKGVAVLDTLPNKRGTVEAGVFWATSNGKAALDSGRALDARVTYLPWYEDNGAKLLHIGAAVRRVSSGPEEFAAKPEMHLAPNFLDTGTLQADSMTQVGLETALVDGPASVQAEYIHSRISQQSGSDVNYSGYYVEGSYFLTGEHRNYSTSSATWGAVSPKHNFDGKGGLGAWQLAARYSHLNLDDSNAVVTGGTAKPGKLSDITLGVNWYLNPNVRVMLNYVHALLDPKDVNGSADAVLMRFQVFF